jgi:hypothetical protein
MLQDVLQKVLKPIHSGMPGDRGCFSLRAKHAVTAMRQITHERGLPKRISCDSGSEYAGSHMDKPADNVIAESFTAKIRERRLMSGDGIMMSTGLTILEDLAPREFAVRSSVQGSQTHKASGPNIRDWSPSIIPKNRRVRKSPSRSHLHLNSMLGY